MFSIYRYVAVASAVVTTIAMLLLGYFYYRTALIDLVDVSERHNVALAKALSAPTWPDILVLLASDADGDAGAAKKRSAVQNIDRFFRKVATGIRILKIKIYRLDGEVVYSSDPQDIGKQRHNSPHPEVFDAVAGAGVPQSKLTFEDHFTAFSGEIFERDVVESYVPVRTADRKIIGVFELYSDVTHTKAKIERTMVSITVGLLIIFLAFYGVLMFVIMRRAISPLRLASSEAAKISPQSPNRRLPTKGMAAEVLPLIEAMNGALDRLDKALDAQRQFTGDAAHELLTPLAVLRANVDTLADKKAVAAIQQDLDAMTSIVTQLLELAELEILGHERNETVDLRDACAEVISRLAPLAVQHGKQIALTGTDERVMARCNARALSRAIKNLVENAITHTPQGAGVEVNLQADGTIRVVDEGPGVPMKDRQLIFQRFWRGKDKNKPGAGLGLSIVKCFAETCGGAVSVGDAPGKGAMFTLQLPLSTDARDAGADRGL